MIVTMLTNVIDLHTHTTHSDGSETPRNLIAMAHAAGACAVAVTDHDTVGGLEEAGDAARALGLEFINGIEISAEYSPGTMHILGYYIDAASITLDRTLAELRTARDTRNPQIAARLRALGFDISYEEVAELAGNKVVGRPHFARLLVKKGYAESIQDAFNRFLAKGAAAYVEKRRLSPAESIDLIHKAGGAAVLAHPYQLKLATLERRRGAADGTCGDWTGRRGSDLQPPQAGRAAGICRDGGAQRVDNNGRERFPRYL